MLRKLLLTLTLLLSLAVNAQTLNLVTTSGPGSLSDTAARYFAPLIEKELNQPVVVHNVPGALGLVGIQHFMKQPANGNYILIAGTQIPYIAKTRPADEFDFTDLTPLHGLSTAKQQVLVPTNSPVKSISDLRSLQKSKGRLLGGSSHPSTQSSMELLDEKLGTQTTVVNYKQSSQLATELAAGLIDYTLGAKGNGSTAGFIQSGNLRVVGDIRDLGIEEFSWTAYFVHSSVPDNRKTQLAQALDKVMHSQEAKKFPQELYLLGPSGVARQVLYEYDIIKVK